MKLATFVFLSLAVVLVNCGHTFFGTNINRPLFYHVNAKYSAHLFAKRIEYVNYTLPHLPSNFGRYIQGVLAYDLTTSGGASCNVTAGGIGMNFVSLRLKSERGKSLKYNIYIYG